jgi:DNA-directed RNA polymerase subunit M
MIFCPKCGSILKAGLHKGKTVAQCSCGFVNRETSGTIRETVRSKTQNVEVVTEETNFLPKTEANCPKCGHTLAYYWMVQTRAGDEPETKFLKCEKCKCTWRDYS